MLGCRTSSRRTVNIAPQRRTWAANPGSTGPMPVAILPWSVRERGSHRHLPNRLPMPYVHKRSSDSAYATGSTTIGFCGRVASPGFTGRGTLITIRVIVGLPSPGHSMSHALTQRHSSVTVRRV